jgi:membrane protease YdiL (CAAX protease family)
MNDSIRPATYREEVAQYTKRDGIHALLYIGYILLVLIAITILMVDFNHDNPLIARFLTVILPIPLYLVPLFVVLRKKGQKISSVGLHLIGWKKALCVGLFIVAVFLMLFDGLLPGLLGGWQFNAPAVLAGNIVILLLLALWEDIVYIGYMQTRLHGLIKSDFLAIGLGGFIFAVVHYPSLIAHNIANGGAWGGAFWGELIFGTFVWIAMHAFFNAIFRQYRSIIAVTLCHFAWNFAMRGELWEIVYEGGFGREISAGIGMFVVLMSIFFIFPLFKKRKTVK